MNYLNYKIVICLSILFISICKALASSQVCTDYGFNSLTIKCDSCEDLKRIVGDDELYNNCIECCVKKAETESYSKAVLEVDQRFINAFQHLPSIVKAIKDLSISSEKSALKIRYKFGSTPNLLLYKSKDDEEFAESISISNWSKDDFDEFIKERVKSTIPSLN